MQEHVLEPSSRTLRLSRTLLSSSTMATVMGMILGVHPSYGNNSRDARFFSRLAGYVAAAANIFESLFHVWQTISTFRHLFAGESFAVVLDRNGQCGIYPFNRDANFRCPRIFHGIVQRFFKNQK